MFTAEAPGTEWWYGLARVYKVNTVNCLCTVAGLCSTCTECTAAGSVSHVYCVYGSRFRVATHRPHPSTPPPGPTQRAPQHRNITHTSREGEGWAGGERAVIHISANQKISCRFFKIEFIIIFTTFLRLGSTET